jgi:hypothetical protein
MLLLYPYHYFIQKKIKEIGEGEPSKTSKQGMKRKAPSSPTPPINSLWFMNADDNSCKSVSATPQWQWLQTTGGQEKGAELEEEGDELVTATRSKPPRVDDKVGKKKGRIDLDAKCDEFSNDASEDYEDLTHQVCFASVFLSHTHNTLTISLRCRRKEKGKVIHWSQRQDESHFL